MWLGHSIQPELRKEPEQAPLDLKEDRSPPMWVLGGCPGIRDEAEASVSCLVGNR